ncbi:hypothetical protein PGB90_002960 [Kerria lacca]
MNISGVGSSSSSSNISSGRFLNNIYHNNTNQRLLQLNQSNEVPLPGVPLAYVDKMRLIPNRRREEKTAVENLQRRIELRKILHSSVNEDFMRTVFNKKVKLENVPFFLKKVI